MSIEEKSVETSTTGKAFPRETIRLAKRWRTLLRSPLWFCLLCALALRIWLAYHTHGMIDGDEAMVGIQAEHILRGEHPLYFYGQAYMGSLEAYLMALLFVIAGACVWTLRAEPILLSLLVVWLTWKLGGALADAAQLSPFAKRLFQTVATLLAAIAPLYDTVVELRALGGYVETFVLILLLFLAIFQLPRRWRAGATHKELAWRWVGIGLIIGVGFWVNPLILTAVLAASIWFVTFCTVELVQLSSRRTTNIQSLLPSFFKKVLLLFVAIPACIIGMIPAIRWGRLYGWANFTFVLQLGDYQTLSPIVKANYHDRLSLLQAQIYLFQHYVAPRVIGGALPGENALLATMHTITLSLGLCCIFASCALFLLSLCWHHPQLLRIRQLVALPLLYAICVSIAFCTSTTAATGLISFQHDLAGRYAAPLMLVLPFFFATIFTLIATLFYKHMKGSPFKDGKQSIRPPRKALAAQIVLFMLLFFYLGAQVVTYANTDADATFQSPSCPMAPAYNDALIAYLQQEHVHYAWAIPWIGNALIFKTNGGIIVADPRVIIFHMGRGRIPAYTDAVERADRPAMLALVQHNDAYPTLLRIINAEQATYHTKRFPSIQGYDVLVVTELSQTIPILSTQTFADAFPVCI